MINKPRLPAIPHNADAIVNKVMQPMRNRLRPKTWPNQLVAGRMIAFEADSWSKPRSLRRLMQKDFQQCREAKRRYRRVEHFYVVASMIEIAINHGLKRGFHSLGCDAAVSALMLAPFDPADPQHRAQDYAGCENDRSDSDFPRSTNLAAYVNGWNHRHARTSTRCRFC